jgi:hypothetical protein
MLSDTAKAVPAAARGFATVWAAEVSCNEGANVPTLRRARVPYNSQQSGTDLVDSHHTDVHRTN